MKRILTLLFAMTGTIMLMAQTLNVNVGEVTYAIPASQAGEMVYTDGTSVTICGKTYMLSEVDSMYIDASSVTDNAVSVVYSGTTAHVTVAGNISKYLTVTATGADVSIVASADLANEITYTLSGTTTDGLFYMDGDYKASFVFNGLNLTNARGAAVDIECGKRISVELAEGTENTLVDGASGSQKACFMVNGHTEFKGAGALTITGNKKHAFWGDEYVELKKTLGTITIAGSQNDGFNINQYFQQNGGTLVIKNVADDGISVSATKDATDENNGQVILKGGTQNITITGTASKGISAASNITISDGTYTISTSGGGTFDTDDNDTKASACLKSDSCIVISGGTLNLTSSGSGGKGINCDSTLTISGGTVNVTTTGGYYTYGSYDSSPKGIKAEGNINITGGAITVNAVPASQSDKGSEGIESKSALTISGGTIEVTSYDDGINAAKDLTISGGKIYVNASNNDAVDANGNLYIKGGLLMVYGASQPECGLDANEEGGYHLYITGGTVVAVGGGTSYPASMTGSQPAIVYGGSVSNGTTVALNTSAGANILTFTMGRSYSGSSFGGGPGGGGPGGGGSGSTTILITSPSLSAGSAYTLYTGATATGDAWHGLCTEATVSSNGTSAGSVTSLSSPYSSIGSTGGGGGRP
jgi:hypothetical protein